MLNLFTASFILICLIATESTVSYAYAQAASTGSSPARAKAIVKVKKKALAAGIDAQVTVRLRSGERLKGRIRDISDESLTLQLLSGDRIESRALNFSDLADIRTPQLPIAARIAIGVGVGLVPLIIAGILVPRT